MRLKEKINIKLYLLASLVPLLILIPFLHNNSEWIGIVILLTGIWINHYFHIFGVAAMINDAGSHKKGVSFLFLLSKTVILAISVIISIQFLQKKLFIAVIIYLYMLLVLSISLRKDKKGISDNEID